MSTPNLPCRYEVSSTTTSADLDQICSTVISEGGTQELGSLRYASTENNYVNPNNEGTLYAIIGMRLKSDRLDAVAKLVNVSILETKSDQHFEWVVLMNPTVSGSFPYVDEDNSSVQIARAPGRRAVTGGTAHMGGHGHTGEKSGTAGEDVKDAITVGAAIDGTRDEVVLCVRPIASSSDLEISAGIDWREFS